MLAAHIENPSSRTPHNGAASVRLSESVNDGDTIPGPDCVKNAHGALLRSAEKKWRKSRNATRPEKPAAIKPGIERSANCGE
jgi:hypothetical protein